MVVVVDVIKRVISVWLSIWAIVIVPTVVRKNATTFSIHSSIV